MIVAPARPAAVATRTRTTTIDWMPLAIATDRCKACELCIGACPKACLALDPTVTNLLGHHPIRLTDPDACTSCAFCARVCPDAVFTVYARPREA
jgi:2-oxoglutarate ferredoxin oxidoreductase subunit delta